MDSHRGARVGHLARKGTFSDISLIHWLGIIAVVVLLCWICFFNGIHILYPIDKTEALQLSLADSMASTGNWVTPSIDGLPYFDKPPLPYWIGALLFRIAPSAPWLPRLGSAIAGTIGVVLTIILCSLGSPEEPVQRRLGRSITAGAVLALMPGYLFFSRIAVHDIYLLVSIVATLVTIFFLCESRSSSPSVQLAGGVVVGFSLGLGVLAKGFLSLGLPFAISLIFLTLIDSEARRPFNWRFVSGLVISLLVVAGPWHVAAWLEKGSVFIDNYLIRTHLHRFASELDDHTGPWFFYLLMYPLLSAPWCIPAVVSLWQQGCLNPRRLRRRAQAEPLLVFCMIWILVTILVLSTASTKLPHYILSTLPPTAIAASYFFWPNLEAERSSDQFSRRLLITTACILALAALLFGLLPSIVIPMSSKAPAFSMALRQQLSSPSMIAGLILLSALGLGMSWQSRRARLGIAGLWTACSLCFLLFQAPSIMHAYRSLIQDPRLAMADLAMSQIRNDEPLQVVGKAWYSIKIYTHGQAEILSRGKAFGESNKHSREIVCKRPGLILGPSTAVEQTIKRCHQGELQLLKEDRIAHLSLARWEPGPSEPHNFLPSTSTQANQPSTAGR